MLSLHPLGKLVAAINGVGKDSLEPWAILPKLLGHKAGSVVVLPIRSVNDERLNHPEGIHGNVPLPTCDFLGGIVASFFSPFCRANRLRIQDGSGWRRFLTASLSHPFYQSGMNLLLGSCDSPLAKYSVNRTPAGEFPW